MQANLDMTEEQEAEQEWRSDCAILASLDEHADWVAQWPGMVSHLDLRFLPL